ncbi:MAG: adenosine kinase, partial [Planctomycetes bacterium]|nr:adenosine kinase [Planctomycetota bacterium]
MSDCELIGVGSPLVDLLLEVDDAFLEAHVDGAKGGMALVDGADIAACIGQQRKKPKQAPGGAAANTTVGCAQLGIHSAFIGSCGDDEYAEYFKDALKDQRCEARLVTAAEQHTGHVLSLITPDAERTMRTTLGAAGMLDPAYFTADIFAGAKVVMLEGYTLFNPGLTRAIATAAKEAGCELALDMASFEVVNANREILDDLLNNYVDIVFANEDEALAWNDQGIEAALNDLASRCKLAIV